MTPGELVIGFYQRMFQIWGPVLIISLVMLVILVIIERRDKYEKENRKTYKAL